MQIDCEVLNTSLIKIKEKSVPENFKLSNKQTVETSPYNVTADSATRTVKQPKHGPKAKPDSIPVDPNTFKPFFVDKVKLNSSNISRN